MHTHVESNTQSQLSVIDILNSKISLQYNYQQLLTLLLMTQDLIIKFLWFLKSHCCDKVVTDLQCIHISELMQPNEECIPLEQQNRFI